MKRFLISIVIFTLAVSCSPAPKNIDLFNDTTCAAPCVLGITPDLTSEKEAKRILRENSSQLDCEEQELWLPSETVYWTQCNDPNATLRVYFRDSKVNYIEISQSNLEVKQVIDKYGAPNAVKASTIHIDSSSMSYITYMMLRYNNINLEVFLTETDGKEYEIKPTTLVSYMRFFSKEGFEHLYKLIQSDWLGYGIYQPNQE